MDPDRRKGVLIVALGAILFAPDSLMIRLMGMEQWPTLFWRGLLGGGAITLLFLAIHRGRYPGKIRALGYTGALFVALFSLTSVCFVFAVRETSVANTLFLVSTSPVFSALISWIFIGERPNRRTLRTIALSMTGVIVIAAGASSVGADGGAGGGASGPNSLAGDLAAIVASAALAASFVAARAVRPLDMSPLIGPAGLITAVIAALLADDLVIREGALAPLLAMGLLIMPVATICLTTGPRFITAPEVSLLMLIEAALGPLIVWWALGENPGVMTLFGGAAIIGALVWAAAEDIGGRRVDAADSRKRDQR